MINFLSGKIKVMDLYERSCPSLNVNHFVKRVKCCVRQVFQIPINIAR